MMRLWHPVWKMSFSNESFQEVIWILEGFEKFAEKRLSSYIRTRLARTLRRFTRNLGKSELSDILKSFVYVDDCHPSASLVIFQ